VVAAELSPPSPPRPGDWRTLREDSAVGHPVITAQLPRRPAVSQRRLTATSVDGAPVEMRWFAPPRDLGGSAVVNAHPGVRSAWIRRGAFSGAVRSVMVGVSDGGLGWSAGVPGVSTVRPWVGPRGGRVVRWWLVGMVRRRR